MTVTYTVEIYKNQYHLQKEMISWCKSLFGDHHILWFYSEPLHWEGLGNWGLSTMFGTTFFYFKHAQDAAWFKLKWT